MFEKKFADTSVNLTAEEKKITIAHRALHSHLRRMGRFGYQDGGWHNLRAMLINRVESATDYKMVVVLDEEDPESVAKIVDRQEHIKNLEDWGNYKLRIYGCDGRCQKDIYFRAFLYLLDAYLVEVERNKRHNKKARPTLWVWDWRRKCFRRIHDYEYDKVDYTSVKKYLQERIIEADDLLEDICLPRGFRKLEDFSKEDLDKMESWLLHFCQKRSNQEKRIPMDLLELVQAVKEHL